MALPVESTIVQRAVTFLGVIAILSVAGICALAAVRRSIPEGLFTIAGAAVGGLGTLLTTFTPAPLPGGRRASDPDVDGSQSAPPEVVTAPG
jgi:hypothetical protein